MGTPKALLQWQGTTLIDHVLAQVRAAAVDDIVVVLGPATQHLAIVDVALAFNPDPATGRSASIRSGCALVADEVAAVLVQSVDQPCPAEVLTALYTAALRLETVVAVPTYAGKRGHPVCFAGSLLPELRKVTEEEQGLRSIVRRHAGRLVEVPVSSESVLWNLNDPAAYAAARATSR